MAEQCAYLSLCCLSHQLTSLKQSTGLSTAHRPAAVHKWLQLCRRNYDQRPEMSDEVSFAEAWWKWWTELQPAWRDRSDDGRPVVGATVGDNWQTLARPGKNGMLITLLTLLWWKEVATQATEASWADAVKDVAWVMEQLAKSARYADSKRLFSSSLTFHPVATSAVYHLTSLSRQPRPRRSDASNMPRCLASSSPSFSFVLSVAYCMYLVPMFA